MAALNTLNSIVPRGPILRPNKPIEQKVANGKAKSVKYIRLIYERLYS